MPLIEEEKILILRKLLFVKLFSLQKQEVRNEIKMIKVCAKQVISLQKQIKEQKKKNGGFTCRVTDIYSLVPKHIPNDTLRVSKIFIVNPN